jgi:tetratricopeptide (TPR) repeat protein
MKRQNGKRQIHWRKQNGEPADSGTQENNSVFKGRNKMKRLIYILLTAVLLMAVTPDGKAQKDTEKKKSEKIENFKYLFSEALKQKIFGNYGNAVKYFLECEKIKPDDAVEYQLSGLFAMAGDQKHAILYGRKALMNDPENLWYYYQLASIYRMYDMKDSLLAVYRQITVKFPDLAKDKMNYADLLVHTGMPGKALEIYKELEKEAGPNLELMQKEAVALLVAGKKEKAMQKIDDAIEIFGKNKDLLLTKAGILMENGEVEKAGEIYRALLEKYPDEPEVEKQVYNYFVDREDYRDALMVLQKIVEDGSVSPQEKINYVFGLSGKINETDTIAQQKLELILNDLNEQYGNDIRTSLLLIDHYSRNEQFSKAKEILRMLLKQYPEYGMGWRQMLYVCDQAGEQDSVIYYGEKAREIFPKDPLYDVYLGYAWLKKGENEKALKYAQEGISKVNRRGVDYVDKESGIDYMSIQKQFYGLLGEIYKNLGEYKKSDEAFEAGLKLDPDDDLLLNNYSYYLSLRKEKLKKALKMSGKTVKRNPDNSTYLDTYGWILYQMGKVKEAEKYILRALKNGGDSSAEILQHYGDILQALGREKEAMEYWRKALEKGADTKEIEKRIKQYSK